MARRTTLPQLLRDKREGAGFTQQTLAERLNCHPSTIAGWESETDRARGEDHLRRAARLFVTLDIDPAEVA